MAMMPGFSNDDGKLLIADTLRLFVGRGRRLGWDDLAAATGDKPCTLRAYVDTDPPAMPFPMFARVFTVLPPEAFARVARHMGFNCAPVDLDDAATIRRGPKEAARLVADGTEYLEDERLTPSERAKLAESAAALLPSLAFIAGGMARP